MQRYEHPDQGEVIAQLNYSLKFPFKVSDYVKMENVQKDKRLEF